MFEIIAIDSRIGFFDPYFPEVEGDTLCFDTYDEAWEFAADRDFLYIEDSGAAWKLQIVPAFERKPWNGDD